jgi:hypothetical protein
MYVCMYLFQNMSTYILCTDVHTQVHVLRVFRHMCRMFKALVIKADTEFCIFVATISAKKPKMSLLSIMCYEISNRIIHNFVIHLRFWNPLMYNGKTFKLRSTTEQSKCLLFFNSKLGWQYIESRSCDTQKIFLNLSSNIVTKITELILSFLSTLNTETTSSLFPNSLSTERGLSLHRKYVCLTGGGGKNFYGSQFSSAGKED